MQGILLNISFQIEAEVNYAKHSTKSKDDFSLKEQHKGKNIRSDRDERIGKSSIDFGGWRF